MSETINWDNLDDGTDLIAAKTKWATIFIAADLSFIPVGLTLGPKRPICKWSQYQTQHPSTDEVTQWIKNPDALGFAILGGSISGNLEIIDIDDATTKDHYLEKIAVEQPTLFSRLVMVDTPKGGLHIYYRCPEVEIPGNSKLAMVSQTCCVIETRGTGGYVVAPGTHPSIHPKNRPYTLRQGQIEAIPQLTPIERSYLIDTAKSFGTYSAPIQAPEAPRLGLVGDRPGDDYNNRASWDEVLIPFGWSKSHVQGDETFWTRPDKADEGWSATTNYQGSDCLYVFSTNTPFEPERGYSKFSAFAVLKFNGDYSKAAEYLATIGYGQTQNRGTPIIADEAETPTLYQWRMLDAKAKWAALNAMPISEVKNVESIGWIWEGFLAKGFVTILHGAEKQGKTTLYTSILRQMKNGGDVHGEIKPCNVLIISEEPAQVWNERKAYTWGDHIRLCTITPLQWDQIIDATLASYQADVGWKPDVVLIDTIASHSGIENENDNAEINNLLKKLNPFKKAGIATLLVHHNRKNGETGVRTASRGGTAFNAYCEIILSFDTLPGQTDEDTGRRIIRRGRCVESNTFNFKYDCELDMYLEGAPDDEHHDQLLINALPYDVSDSDSTAKGIYEKWKRLGLFDKSYATATRKLKYLEESGNILKHGAGKALRYCQPKPLIHIDRGNSIKESIARELGQNESGELGI